MSVRVRREGPGHRLIGDGPITDLGNRYLAHLEARGFSAATVRGYAYDLLCLSRFMAVRKIQLLDVMPMDLFD